MQNTVSLEEELRKANAARSQLETYKRQVRRLAWFLDVVCSWIPQSHTGSSESTDLFPRCLVFHLWNLVLIQRLSIGPYSRYLCYVLMYCTESWLLCSDCLWLQQSGHPLYWGAQVYPCSGLSCCRAWALGARASVTVAPGLSGVAHGLSCPAAYGIFPDQELNPRALHWQADC